MLDNDYGGSGVFVIAAGTRTMSIASLRRASVLTVSFSVEYEEDVPAEVMTNFRADEVWIIFAGY